MTITIAGPAALTFKDAAALVQIDVRKIKAGVESGTIPSIQLGARRMIPRAALLRVFGIVEDERAAS
ncbi:MULTISPECIES: helix-turn-helix domain-containing protein [unclassified Rathayibacter]|uniref:helix-turn-helix domain-containing protein n=1 Tax=unclassified Rathayibacter TaxID=2609250 RepID=UPI00215708F1|nr:MULTISPECIES: helix-turn-helix domain-containing protein [unclassified Rathayibacter]